MKRTKAMKKRISTSIMVGLMAIVVTVGGTLAYLSTKTEAKTNAFTFLGSNDISATLTEPKWEAGIAASPDYGKKLTPGSVVDKNPIITNTCALDEYVAARVTFQTGDGTTMTDEEYTKLMGMIEIDWNLTDWELIGTEGPVNIYDYKTLLTGAEAAPYSETNSLFETVTIKNDLTNEDMNWLKETIHGYKIYIEGAAIQGSEFADLDAAKTELNGLFQ